MKLYEHTKIEKKWQSAWLDAGLYEPDLDKAKTPFYNLMMFPYPSAEGLHVGNMYAFCGSDIYGRYMRMKGFSVFEPIGLDGFGIHSENFALKIGQHPMELAKKTEANFYRQLKQTGNAYYWSNKLETYKSDYYKWTQWIFILLFKAGLAYRAKSSVNWCPTCLTVLADEQVVGLGVCERCGTKVAKKELAQWFFRITDYAQRLLDGLTKIDWSEKVKLAQANWLGKSEGVEIVFPCDIEKNTSISIFTTRIDTIFGVTYMALAPQHPLVTTIVGRTKGLLKQQINRYVANSLKKANERGNSVIGLETGGKAEPVKTGVFTSFYAKNPVSGKKIPIYIADYVLMEYGTGAIMGVPAHDRRDWEFAKKYGIDIVEVVKNDLSQEAYTGEGSLINSGKFNGFDSRDAIQRLTKYIEKYHLGSQKTTWHLRDWIISRQRYWGPPIPMIFCKSCEATGKSWFTTNEAKNLGIGISKFQTPNSNSKKRMAGWYPVPEEDLPVELPYIKNFKPTGIGASPLASDPNFVKVKCPHCGGEAHRETDVSDTFLDSAWYFLRYPSIKTPNSPPAFELSKTSRAGKLQTPKKLEIPWDRELTKKWLPVDMYIGGAEHAVLHLLYSRFLWKVFYDLGYFDFSAKSPKGQLGGPAKMPASGWEEPFTKFRAHGLLISQGAKMSKSKGNVVLPDAYIEKYGADTLRCYLMFCGRFTQGGDFRDSGIEGMRRFLNRVWRLVQENSKFHPSSTESRRGRETPNSKFDGQSAHMMHKTVKRVTEDIESLDYNTAIAAMMEWVNALEERTVGSDEFIVHSQDQKNKKNLQTKNYELITREEVQTLLLLLAPFAPHMTEELWQQMKVREVQKVLKVLQVEKSSYTSRTSGTFHTFDTFDSIHKQPWPKYDPKLAEAQEIVLVVEVNGRVRDKITVTRGIGREEAEKLALESAKVTKYLQKGKLKKVIFVPDRLINFVI